MLKPCKSVQETSEEVMFIKAWQIARQIISIEVWCLCSAKTVSIENYKIQISRSFFHAYPSYLCRVSFLTTLDIYKDYFKGRQRWCKVMQLDAKSLCMHIVTEDNCPSSSYSCVEVAASLHQGYYNQGASWSSSFGWTEKLCSQHISQVGVLVMY